MFVAIEGPDASGKSTLQTGLAQALGEEGRLVVTTRQPGGGKIGPRLREILKDPELQEATTPLARRLLMEVDQLCQAPLIRALLEADTVVVSDRHCPVSNHCYISVEGTPWPVLHRIEMLDQDRLLADLVILLDVPADECWRRIQESDRLDPSERSREAFDRVHSRYTDLVAHAAQHGYIRTTSGFVLPAIALDGTAPVETLVSTALQAVLLRIRE